MTSVSRYPRRAAGTRTGWDVFKAGYRAPREQAIQADLTAIGRHEGRSVACFFRGFAPEYPVKFVFRALDLLPGEIRLRPYWFTPSRQTIYVRQSVTAVYVRARNPASDRRIRSIGNYRPDGRLWWAGSSVIVGETIQGRLEFGVPNPDVRLVLAYFQQMLPGRDAAN